MKYDKKTFAHNAKVIRLLAGCKQIEFSKIIDLPIKTIGAIEESRSITPEILLKYSEFAGATINDLLLNKIEITTTNKNKYNYEHSPKHQSILHITTKTKIRLCNQRKKKS